MLRFLTLLCVAHLPLAAAEDALDLNAMVEQLGDEDFNLRQQASEELMRRVEQDPEFAKPLKAFADHEDPEVRSRIAKLTKDLPVILPWLDPKNEEGMKSTRASAKPMQLTVKNRSQIEIQTHWIDWAGIRQPRRKVKAGEQIVIEKTYAGHPWLLTDAKGRALGGVFTQGRERHADCFYGQGESQG